MAHTDYNVLTLLEVLFHHEVHEEHEDSHSSCPSCSSW